MKMVFTTSIFSIVFTTSIFSADVQARLEYNNSANGSVHNASLQSAIPASFIALEDYAVLVEKSTQKLYLYDRDYNLTKTFHVTTGQRQGGKTAQGDHKTPEGIYFFTVVKEDRELLPEYGVMALSINYPNFIDTILRKNGNGIWLHATNQPTRPLKPYDTRGCVVAANEDIVELAEHIKLQTTPIVIVDEIEYETLEKINNIRQELFKFIEKWRTSWKKKDIDGYMDSYSKSFKANGLDWQGWRKYKESLNHQYTHISISLSDVKILRHNNHVVISFTQRYKNNKLASRGIKRLYLAHEDSKWKILGEEWSPIPAQKPAIIATRYAAYKKPALAKVEASPEQKIINHLPLQQAKLESQPSVNLSLIKADSSPEAARGFVNPVRSSSITKRPAGSINNSSSMEKVSNGVNGRATQQSQKESAFPSRGAAIDIEDFTIDGDDTANKIKFRLVNKIGEGYKISGRLAIIAENKGNNEVRYSSYPPMMIEQGIPKDFRKGEWFSIRRFKIVRGGFEERTANLVSVLVYSKEGELLLNKKFPIQIKQ